MRWKGLRVICKSFRHPSLLPIAFLVRNLGYKNEATCVEDLKTHGAVINEENDICLDTAASLPVFAKPFTFKVMDGDSLELK